MRSSSPGRLGAFFVLGVHLVGAANVASAAEPARGRPSGERAPRRTHAEARIVLVGKMGQSDELELVLRELLERQGIVAEIVHEERFRSRALLSEGERDARVSVFVLPNGERAAHLYFRGPFGKRFLLRELALKNGLGEIGRELIGQVVETSTLALIETDVGLSREEAEAGIEKTPEGEPAREPEVASTPSPGSPEEPKQRSASSFEGLVGARGVALLRGRALGLGEGAGLEAGLGYRGARPLVLRLRGVFEWFVPSTLETSRVDARFGSLALRGGVDVGTRAGANAFLVGLSGGVDLTRIEPVVVKEASLALGADSRATIPVVRLEARYERTLGLLVVSGALVVDVPLVNTHYDLAIGGVTERLAEPPAVRPGLSLGLGVAP